MNRTHRTATNADSVLPPTTDHGCASGLAGNVNTSTALAPSGAINHVAPGTADRRHSTPVIRIPSNAPATERQRSGKSTVSGAGRKPFSQVRRMSDQFGLRARAPAREESKDVKIRPGLEKGRAIYRKHGLLVR